MVAQPAQRKSPKIAKVHRGKTQDVAPGCFKQQNGPLGAPLHLIYLNIDDFPKKVKNLFLTQVFNP